jgi:hypothetical protein
MNELKNVEMKQVELEHRMKQLMIVLSLMLVLSGCTATAPTTGETTQSDERPKVSSAFPSDFPVPLYPGAKVISVDKMKLPSGLYQMAINTQVEPIKDAPSIIGTFYTQKLQSAGWQIQQQPSGVQSEDAAYVAANKGDELIQISASNHNNFEPKSTTIEMDKYINPPGSHQ